MNRITGPNGQCFDCLHMSGQEIVAIATVVAVALAEGKNLQELQCLANLISNIGLQMINIANQVALQKGEPDISFL